MPMSRFWTGGQYSIFRVLLGAYLLVHFAMLLPYGAEVFASGGAVAKGAMSPLFGALPNPLLLSDAPMMVLGLLCAGCVCAIALAIGWWDRVAAVLCALILGWLFQRNPLIANPSLPLVGWMLVLHAFVPVRPYGSLAVRRHGADPAWRLPSHLHLAVWVMLALCYSHSGWTKLQSPSWVDGNTIRLVLENPLARDHVLREWLLAKPPILLQSLTWLVLVVELMFAPLVLSRRLRPWLWATMLAVQLGFLCFLNFADLTFPMLLVHLLAFQPEWLARFERKEPALVLFDGSCAFCHGSVRLAMYEDVHSRLRFAPLDGTAARALVNAAPQTGDDSILVVDEHGGVERKSRAVAALLQRLGGLWLAPAALLHILPRALCDAGYDLVGRWRYRIAGTSASCELLPPAFASRMLR